MSKIARKRGQARPGYEKDPQERENNDGYCRIRLSTTPSSDSVASATPTAALARASAKAVAMKRRLPEFRAKARYVPTFGIGDLYALLYCPAIKLLLASSPVSPIFSKHARKEGEPGIQNHVRDVGPYTRVGRVAGGENCAWASTTFERSRSTRV